MFYAFLAMAAFHNPQAYEDYIAYTAPNITHIAIFVGYSREIGFVDLQGDCWRWNEDDTATRMDGAFCWKLYRDLVVVDVPGPRVWEGMSDEDRLAYRAAVKRRERAKQ